MAPKIALIPIPQSLPTRGEGLGAYTESDAREAADALRAERLGRAIGVVYRPGTERISRCFEARLPNQFDAVIHIDATRAWSL